MGDIFVLERQLWSESRFHIVGVDEVGRGAAAGPVLVAAVLVPFQWHYREGIKDSKKLTPVKRSQLRTYIEAEVIDFSVATRPPEMIDEINIRNATLDAMHEAVLQIARRHPIDLVLVDGRDIIPCLKFPQKAVTNGEDQSIAIASASIVAKERRDELMVQLDQEYDEIYNWSRNKGYLTRDHASRILKYGVSPQHRRSFVRKLLLKHSTQSNALSS